MKSSQLKKHVPHLKFCILFYWIYRNYRRADFSCTIVRQYVFQNHVKVVKYTCRLRDIIIHMIS